MNIIIGELVEFSSSPGRSDVRVTVSGEDGQEHRTSVLVGDHAAEVTVEGASVDSAAALLVELISGPRVTTHLYPLVERYGACLKANFFRKMS